MKSKVVLYKIQHRDGLGYWVYSDGKPEPTPEKARAEIAIRKAQGDNRPMRFRRFVVYVF